MRELTNEQIRALVIARKPCGHPMIVVVRPYVGEDRFELHFELQWVPALTHYEACPVRLNNGVWTQGDVYKMSAEQEEAFRAILLRLYGIEEVCFSPATRKVNTLNLVLGLTPLIR